MAIAKPTFPRLQRGHPLVRGLVAAWTFHEGSGPTARDLSGRQNHGTLANGPAWVGGERGSAISFDGSNDRINIPAMALSVFSLSLWWQPLGITNLAGPLTYAAAGNAGFGFFGNEFGTTIFRPRLGIYDGAAWTAWFKTSGYTISVPAADRHHLVWTYDGSTARFYADGVEQAVATTTQTGASSGLYLGRAYNNVAGPMDAPMFWNRPLSAAEAAQLNFDPFAMFRSRRILRPSAVTAHPYSYGFIFN